MPTKTKRSLSWLRLGYILLAAIAMCVLISQISSLKGSWSNLRLSNRRDDLLVLVFASSTYVFATLTYYFISLKPLKYLRTLVVELAINVLNRLLPAGLGTIGANYVYLSKSKHSKSQAAAVVAANTITGIVANLILLGVLLIYFPSARLRFSSINSHLVLIIILILAALSLVFMLIPNWRRLIVHRSKIIIRDLGNYRFLKLRLSYGLLCQIGLTLAYVLALSFSLKAVHGYLPIGSLMLAYSFGIWVGTLIPAPGGVGSVDAGLVAGLLAFKVDLMQAVSAVLIFRLLSFWLPLILGILPLIWSYRRGYL